MHRAVQRVAVAAAASTILAGMLCVAAPALSAAVRGPVGTVARSVHTSVEGQREVELPIAASHVVLHWQGNSHAQVSVAFGAGPSAYGPSQPVVLDEDGPDDDVQVGDAGGEA